MELTDKQARFAVEYVKNGGKQTPAYIEIYKPKSKNMNTIYRKAHEVRSNAKVMARIRELQMSTYMGDILTIKQRKEILTTLSLKGDIKALDVLNRMDGLYAEKEVVDNQINVTIRRLDGK